MRTKSTLIIDHNMQSAFIELIKSHNTFSSLSALATKAGLNRSTVTRLMALERLPGDVTVKKICKALDISQKSIKALR